MFEKYSGYLFVIFVVIFTSLNNGVASQHNAEDVQRNCSSGEIGDIGGKDVKKTLANSRRSDDDNEDLTNEEDFVKKEDLFKSKDFEESSFKEKVKRFARDVEDSSHPNKRGTNIFKIMRVDDEPNCYTVSNLVEEMICVAFNQCFTVSYYVDEVICDG